ncbi:MAG: ribosome small subunit-dependent GTPase A [Corallococcus sp.]|nr:ribosome small subunit-dependent GTPase A [Corallococcus sp.]
MTDRNIGKVVKSVGGVFTVVADGKKYLCFAPKKIRFGGARVLVGDKVSFSVDKNGKGVICEVLPRSNCLKRPEVANIDIALIVIAKLPQTDFELVDKILVNCVKEGIIPILVINKIDIADAEFISQVQSDYNNVCRCVCVSALTGEGTEQLHRYIGTGTACLVGQSAVGKTSLLNILLNIDNSVGGLSQKTMRGRHTTRHSQIYESRGGFLVDTTGFSLLELSDIPSKQLMLYYEDMISIAGGCKFSTCTHIAEPNCAVKQAVQNGNYSQYRYERYRILFEELAEAEKNKY